MASCLSTSEESTDDSYKEDCQNEMNSAGLNKRVSGWSISQVEEALQIYYNEEYMMSPFDTLQKIPSILTDLSEAQRVYIQKIRGYITFNVENFDKLLFNSQILKDNVESTLQELKAETAGYVKKKVKKFARSFGKLVQDVECTRIQSTVFKGNYTKFVAAFAELCCLEVEFSLSKNDQAVWENLRGILKVISLPVMRFLKDGLEEEEEDDDTNSLGLVVTMVEFKNDKEWKPSHRRLTTATNISYNSSSSSSDTSSVPKLRRSVNRRKHKDKRRRKTHLEVRLNSNIVGQHAGELLLDLRRCCKDEEQTTFTMPGMIVDGTKVFFTVLEMTRKHFKKLMDNEELDHDDKAVIYYSTPLDILLRKDRDVLIENLMKFNNYQKQHVQNVVN